MGTRLKALALLIATAAVAAQAGAQPSKPTVELLGERGELDSAKLDTLVVLELGADVTRVVGITIDVRSGRADVDVRLGMDHRKGSVALESLEPERALALFVGELARGTTRPALESRTTPRTIAQPAQPEERPAAPAPLVTPRRAFVLGTMGARVVTTRGAVLATPRLEIGARQEGRLRLGLSTRYGYASSEDPLGAVTAHALAGGAAVTYLLLSRGSFALATGPRFETGLVAGRGDGRSGTSATALTLGGSWEIELHAKVAGFALLGAVEVGSYFEGIELHADERDVLHLSGPFVGLALGAML